MGKTPEQKAAVSCMVLFSIAALAVLAHLMEPWRWLFKTISFSMLVMYVFVLFYAPVYRQKHLQKQKQAVNTNSAKTRTSSMQQP